MNLAERTEALLALIEEQRLAHRRSVLGETSAAAARIVKEAHLLARRRVRALMNEERDRANASVSAAQSHAESRSRKMRQEQRIRLLDLARTRLREELERLWTGPARRQWLDHYASLAVDLLPRQEWVVQHPEDWTDEDGRVLEERLRVQGVAKPQYVPDPAIRAGIRIRAGDATLDATLEGLLMDRYAIDGRLVAHLASANR